MYKIKKSETYKSIYQIKTAIWQEIKYKNIMIYIIK